MTSHPSWKLAAPLIALVLSGCGSAGPARAPIEGRVVVGGQPLSSGRILFTPVAPTQGPATSARIVQGRYQLDAADGPVVGQNRVEVEGDRDLGFALDDEAALARRRGKSLPTNPVPPAYNIQSQLTVEVKADAANTYDVVIPAAAQAASRR